MDRVLKQNSARPIEAVLAPRGSRQNRIVLRVEGGSWVADHYGPCAVEVVTCFGTHSVPTCFTSRAPASRVKAEIEAMNPGVLVEVA